MHCWPALIFSVVNLTPKFTELFVRSVLSKLYLPALMYRYPTLMHSVSGFTQEFLLAKLFCPPIMHFSVKSRSLIVAIICSFHLKLFGSFLLKFVLRHLNFALRPPKLTTELLYLVTLVLNYPFPPVKLIIHPLYLISRLLMR
jgi:hypothetical protein